MTSHVCWDTVNVLLADAGCLLILRTQVELITMYNKDILSFIVMVQGCLCISLLLCHSFSLTKFFKSTSWPAVCALFVVRESEEVGHDVTIIV